MQPFNKYYPPNYDGKSNINKMAGTHALGRRAHKLNQGILIVRFELPFNIWCGNCKQHIGQGVRFNAEKKRIGSYYTTPIWSFRMKCHLCSAWFEVKTDPEHTQYVIVEGAKRQADEWDTTDQGVVQPKDVVEKQRMDDPFARLEKEEDDKTKASEQLKVISKLYEVSHRQWSDPWTQSKRLRKDFREKKKVLKEKEKLDEDIRTRNGLHIPLLPEAEEDTIKAKMIDYNGKEGREADLRRRELKTGSLVLGKRDRNGNSKKDDLQRMVKINTLERSDPFLNEARGGGRFLKGTAKVVKRGRNGGAVGLVDGYSSASD